MNKATETAILIMNRFISRVLNDDGEIAEVIASELSDEDRGTIDWLEDLEQLILPPPCFGWHRRSKYRFFDCYRIVVEQMAQESGFDPWLLWPMTSIARDVDFNRVATASSASSQLAGCSLPLVRI